MIEHTHVLFDSSELVDLMLIHNPQLRLFKEVNGEYVVDTIVNMTYVYMELMELKNKTRVYDFDSDVSNQDYIDMVRLVRSIDQSLLTDNYISLVYNVLRELPCNMTRVFDSSSYRIQNVRRIISILIRV